MENQNILQALNAGLVHLEDRDVRVRSDLVNDIAVLKSVIKAVISGQLVLASPDQLKTEAEPNIENT